MTRPGGRMAGASAWRTMHQDSSVVEHKLAPGTLRRVVGFARPFRRDLVVFLVLTVISSVIGVVTPLLAGDVVNQISGKKQVQGLKERHCPRSRTWQAKTIREKGPSTCWRTNRHQGSYQPLKMP